MVTQSWFRRTLERNVKWGSGLAFAVICSGCGPTEQEGEVGDTDTTSGSSNGDTTGAAPDNGSESGVAPLESNCDDDVLNDEETDVDCGGSVCEPCDIGQMCAGGDDCLSSRCAAGLCTSPTCGDGVQDDDEDCDDGEQTADCDADCTAPECGDGVVNAAAGESCDDGDNVGGEGECLPGCGGLQVCGDAATEGDEECDDGVNAGGDGNCTSACVLQSCGNGTLEGTEACDNGVNSGAPDGCIPGCIGAVPACHDSAEFTGTLYSDETSETANVTLSGTAGLETEVRNVWFEQYIDPNGVSQVQEHILVKQASGTLPLAFDVSLDEILGAVPDLGGEANAGGVIELSFGHPSVGGDVECPTRVSVSLGCNGTSSLPVGSWTETANGGEIVTLTQTESGIWEFSNFNFAYYNPSNNPIRGILAGCDPSLPFELIGETEYGVQWRGQGTYDSKLQQLTFPQIEDVTFNPGIFGGPYVFEFNND